MGGQRNERKKWAQCFDDVTAIIFVTSTSSYNLKMIDDENSNKLQESISIFSDILSNR
ncbi:hypothetical protein A3Q56_08164 [Intoshia linei]|uniref:Uncharacterized protein n=1 Tax=Intoshia linei TaxID=1819745 RepID=A0A177AQ36_9BILA|nr:hypothetical protein A3Q56_08164 [Intoshia linei]